ncbi:hypothetical protein ACTMTJ_17500 [Phytohabitans sp. LJ34]|uniref:YncE family protein n=1 Tax=Phytohabitans sp. LJ34 TaxID=3452217 RepID=UPI003F8CA2C1
MYGRDIIATRHWPVDLAVSRTGERLYLVNFHPPRLWWLPHRGSISLVDTETGRERRLRRHSVGVVALHPEGTHLYVAAESSGRVSVIDLARRRRVARIRVGVRPRAVLADPGGDRVYVANGGDGTVSVIAMWARTVVATIHSGRWPSALALGGDWLYVANQGDGSVTTVDIECLTGRGAVPVGGTPEALCVSPSGDRLYVATSRPAAIQVLRTDPLEPIGTIPITTRYPQPPILSTDPPLEPEPSAVAVSRDGARLVVGLAVPGTVQVVDLAGERIVDEYELGLGLFEGPSRIVADPRTDRFYIVCVGPDLTVLG